MKFYIRNFKGVTLIALIITIIVLLILSGLTISLVLNNGIINHAFIAKQKTQLSQLQETIDLIRTELIISNYKKPNDVSPIEFAESIKKDSNFIGSTIQSYNNDALVLTTPDRLYDVLIKPNLFAKVFNHSSLLQGTWLFNEKITYPSDLYLEFDGTFHNNQYSFPIYSIQCNEKFGYNCFFPWYWTNLNQYHPLSFAYLPQNTLGFPEGWVWLNVDTYASVPVTGVKLTVNSDIAEVKDINGKPAGDQLLEWLQKNAIKL